MTKDNRTQQQRFHDALKTRQQQRPASRPTDRPAVPRVREVLFGRKR